MEKDARKPKRPLSHTRLTGEDPMSASQRQDPEVRKFMSAPAIHLL